MTCEVGEISGGHSVPLQVDSWRKGPAGAHTTHRQWYEDWELTPEFTNLEITGDLDENSFSGN